MNHRYKYCKPGGKGGDDDDDNKIDDDFSQDVLQEIPPQLAEMGQGQEVQ